jgi:signal recognition particle receptor subunit beta
MPTINKAFKEISCKIVYYGPGLCGKTTNLQIIHKQIPSKNRGELVSLATEQDRTLFFDFLPLDLGEVKGFKTKFQLYTVPGQVFYNATRKLVLRGVDGVIFVADSHPDRLEDNQESFENLRENLAEYNLDLDEIPLALQYNKRDLPNVLPIEEMEKALNPSGKWKYYEAVAVEGKGVKETLKGVSSLVLARINDSVGGSGNKPPSRLAEEANKREKQRAAAGVGASGPVIPQAAVAERAAPAALASSGGMGGNNSSAAPAAAPPAEKTFKVMQEGKARWRGLPCGSTRLEFKQRSNVDGKGDYELSGVVKGFLSKKYWFKMMERAEPPAESRPSRQGFVYFRESPNSKDKNKPVEVWVEEKEPPVMFAREIDGSREFAPAGRSLKEILS